MTLGSGMYKVLEEHAPKITAIDEDIKILGLKNPIYLVIIGFATRKVLEACRKFNKEIHRILVIEPDMGRFKATLEREFVADLIDDENIDFVVGIPLEELQVNIYKLFAKADTKQGPAPTRCLQPEIIVDPFAYPGADGKQHPEAERIITSITSASKQVFTSMGCSADTYSRWHQTARNFGNLHNAYKISELFGKFPDTPTIVVGGGPSVEQFIEAYHKYDLGKKAVVIACDAVLRRLLKENIRPHIVTRCERKFTTIFGDLTKEDTKGVFYCAYTWTPPEFFDLFEDKFVCFRDNGVNGWTGYKPGSINV